MPARTKDNDFHLNNEELELVAKALTAYKKELDMEASDDAADLREYNTTEESHADILARKLGLDLDSYQTETAGTTHSRPMHPTQTQCTPGPWEVAARFEPENEPPYILIKGPGNLPMKEAATDDTYLANRYYDPHIAKVYFDRTADHSEQFANANAIAKVPELTAKLSLLIRTVWDTFRHRNSPAQWDSLESCTKEAAELLFRK